ncbi:cadherin domain-containing protein, partial [Gammaproteobacteria bacterium]|nr:cadherin domain-containing protein [Gammaproteobacteria bacterium]
NATFFADENQTTIGTTSNGETNSLAVSSTDADGDDITFSISGSEININASTGVLTFASAPDYETKSSYTATVTASDGSNSATLDISVNVVNVNEAPVYTGDASRYYFTINENQTNIGTVEANDPEGDTITYTTNLTAGCCVPDILIDASSGVLTFASPVDYENTTWGNNGFCTYATTLSGPDGIKCVTLTIVNLNDNSPSFTSNATFTADENQTAIGTVTATDADSDSITFSISGSEINIDASTGVLTFVTAPDYETKSSYTATVTASDGTNSATQNITVNINNLNEFTPSFTSNATFTVDENQTAIGTVITSDGDGDTLTYSISGSEINIDSSSGVLTFVSAPDFETKSSYSATVTVSDGTNSITQDITVNIIDIQDITATLSLSIDAIKSFTFNWSDVYDVISEAKDSYWATSYKILVKPDDDSSYTQIGDAIGPSVASAQEIAPLHKRIDAKYILQTCYDENCYNSDPLSVASVSSNLVEGIGYIKPNRIDNDDNFGSSVSLSGDGNTLVVGARYEDSNATGINGDQTDNSSSAAGADYIFTRSGTTWSQQSYIKASNTGDGDQFGYAVSLSDDGNTLAVGARYEDSNATGINGDQTDNSSSDAGAAYLFTRSGTTWSQQSYIKASNTGDGDQFGYAVSLSDDGNTLAVTAREESYATGINGDQTDNSSSSSSAPSGAAYVFARSGTTWSQQSYLKRNINYGTFTGEFGNAIKLSGDGNTIAVGERRNYVFQNGINGDQTNSDARFSGAIYAFGRSGETWSFKSFVKASNTGSNDNLGRDQGVALSDDGNTLVGGALGEQNSQGAIYIY